MNDKNQSKTKSRAVLLDLSSDSDAALRWARSVLGDVDLQQINKSDLKWAAKIRAVRLARALKPETFLVYTGDSERQSARGALVLFGIVAGARRVVIGDGLGRAQSRSRAAALLIEAPRLAVEFVIGFGLIIPLSLLLTEGLGLSLPFRKVSRSKESDRVRTGERRRARRALYIRATLASAKEGGMLTHVAGFASGAAALGHELTFLVSDSNRDEHRAVTIPPSPALSPNRALFELWNNLAFSLRSLRIITRGELSTVSFDFIYQRYSRFNWTGVLLSMATGLPLLLEFNGSEVWISRHWDPIGLRWLLKRFERLNLRAADLIFVVSEAQRRSLIDSGFDSGKIICNPNGVDEHEFRPEVGGAAIRRSLGIESERTVVGFIGTFGPWHGAPVLAEAARLINPKSRFHFLFMGDGDERAKTESIIRTSGVSATFTGRLSREKVPAYLDSCDLLAAPHVHPSDGSEFFGSPTKLFEYMAMAKPVVASRLGQIAEVIVGGENGLLVDPGDRVQLARAIEKLAQDSQLRRRLGANARSTVVELYTWKRNAARVFECFDQRFGRSPVA
jgi:glycosyltransferase involved in cell wall biosynthesis